MGFLERAIRRGISDAVGKAMVKAIEPTVTDLTNKYVKPEPKKGSKLLELFGL